MRSEQEMFDLIINTAKNDERVRAVILNGSRANPNAPRDFFQDYDIVYVVRDVGSFTADHGWIKIFGALMILQMPNLMQLIPMPPGRNFTYLMQFADGNRIDLTLVPVDKVLGIERESQSILLLDKDGLIPPFMPASDADFIIRKPKGKVFQDCCNEFWWLCPYVAKGIWREELPYAMQMFNKYLRDELIRMTEWYIGVRTGFAVSAGKHGKYFGKYLEGEIWEMYLQTYADANYGHLWDALFAAGDLFRLLAINVADALGFQYPYDDDRCVSAHLEHVKELPRNAREMY